MLVCACVCVHCYDGVLLRQRLVQASLFASLLLFVIAIFTWVALLPSSVLIYLAYLGSSAALSCFCLFLLLGQFCWPFFFFHCLGSRAALTYFHLFLILG